jgi:hypothetical protein
MFCWSLTVSTTASADTFECSAMVQDMVPPPLGMGLFFYHALVPGGPPTTGNTWENARAAEINFVHHCYTQWWVPAQVVKCTWVSLDNPTWPPIDPEDPGGDPNVTCWPESYDPQCTPGQQIYDVFGEGPVEWLCRGVVDDNLSAPDLIFGASPNHNQPFVMTTALSYWYYDLGMPTIRDHICATGSEESTTGYVCTVQASDFSETWETWHPGPYADAVVDTYLAISEMTGYRANAFTTSCDPVQQ